MRRYSVLFISASLLSLTTATTTLAQTASPPSDAPADNGNTIQDIVVTAERFTSTGQKTAAAISIRNGEDLTNQGRYSLANILDNVPGVTGGAAENTGSVTGGTDNPAAGLTIRGIQSNVGSGGSITSTAASAALYVDGVYNGIGSTYDIDQIEILRGPQGTLYGRSATSGVVAVHTRDPDLTHYGADGLLHVGSYDLVQASAAVNIPVIDDQLAIRISGNHYERDGFYSREGGRRQTDDARIKLLYKPTENFSALLGAALQYNKVNVGGVSINQTAPNTYAFNQQEYGTGRNHFWQFWGEFNLDLGGINVTWLPAYKTWYQDTRGISRGGTPEFNQTIRTPTDNFLTQELRISSQSSPNLKWQAGLFYYYNNLRDSNELVIHPANFLAFRSASHKTTRNVGAFGEATYTIADTTRVTAGLRYDYTRVRNNQDYTVIRADATGIPIPDANGNLVEVTQSLTGDQGLRTFNNVTYKARIEHDLTPSNLIYASISSGFSPGDVAIATDSNYTPTVVELKAQTLTAYELGSKNRFLGNRLQINGAVYYNDYGGYQTAGINTTPQNPSNPTFNTIVAPVKVYGAELEVVGRPWFNGQVGLNAAYTRARYGNIEDQYEQLFSSHVVPGVIPFQATAWLEQKLDLSTGTLLSARGELTYRSAFSASRITEAQQELGARPYVRNSDTLVANLSATLLFKDSGLAITGYVRNIGDVRYKLNGGVQDAGAGFSSAVELSDPRTWGVTASVKF